MTTAAPAGSCPPSRSATSTSGSRSSPWVERLVLPDELPGLRPRAGRRAVRVLLRDDARLAARPRAPVRVGHALASWRDPDRRRHGRRRASAPTTAIDVAALGRRRRRADRLRPTDGPPRRIRRPRRRRPHPDPPPRRLVHPSRRRPGPLRGLARPAPTPPRRRPPRRATTSSSRSAWSSPARHPIRSCSSERSTSTCCFRPAAPEPIRAAALPSAQQTARAVTARAVLICEERGRPRPP